MLSKTVLALAGLVAAANAIEITAPAMNAQVDLSQTTKITWTSVNTDPTSFDIQLVDDSADPPVSYIVAFNVTTSSDSFDLTNFVAKVDPSYQINFVGDSATDNGIIAQSQRFAVIKSGVAPTTTLATSTATSTSSSTAAATTTHKSGAVGKTFGVAAPIFALLSFLL